MNICLLPPTHPGPDPVGSLKSEGITLLQIKNRSLFLPRVCSMSQFGLSDCQLRSAKVQRLYVN